MGLKPFVLMPPEAWNVPVAALPEMSMTIAPWLNDALPRTSENFTGKPRMWSWSQSRFTSPVTSIRFQVPLIDTLGLTEPSARFTFGMKRVSRPRSASPSILSLGPARASLPVSSIRVPSPVNFASSTVRAFSVKCSLIVPSFFTV